MQIERGKNPQDIAAGLLMIACGLFWGFWAYYNYRIGTPTRMGPGWFPMYLGFLLAFFGFVIMIPGFFRKGTFDKIQWGPAFWITAGVVAFAASVKVIGLTPASFLCLGLASLGDKKLTWKTYLILATLFSIAAHIVFYVLLEVQLPPFIWPFQ